MNDKNETYIPIGYMDINNETITFYIPESIEHCETLTFYFHKDFVDLISSGGWLGRYSYEDLKYLPPYNKDGSIYFNPFLPGRLRMITKKYDIDLRIDNLTFIVKNNQTREIFLKGDFALLSINQVDNPTIKKYLLKLYNFMQPILERMDLDKTDFEKWLDNFPF